MGKFIGLDVGGRPLYSEEKYELSSVADEAAEASAERDVWKRRAIEAKARVAELEARAAALEAKIDSLMWEYCPDEMTDEQKDNWAKHQVPAEDYYE